MTTGPQHYAKAERILGALVANSSDAKPIEAAIVSAHAAVAQVHATLALAAATALAAANEVHATTGAGTDWDQIIGGAS